MDPAKMDVIVCIFSEEETEVITKLVTDLGIKL